MSVYWFRGLHPEPVYLRPDGPTAPREFIITLVVAFIAYTCLFLGLYSLRYGTEVATRQRALRAARTRKLPT